MASDDEVFEYDDDGEEEEDDSDSYEYGGAPKRQNTGHPIRPSGSGAASSKGAVDAYFPTQGSSLRARMERDIHGACAGGLPTHCPPLFSRLSHSPRATAPSPFADFAEVVSLPQDEAMLLLHACRWKKNVAEERWFEDPEKVRRTTGGKSGRRRGARAPGAAAAPAARCAGRGA
jgi:hypothetical protein